jgi:hypothetical protein
LRAIISAFKAKQQEGRADADRLKDEWAASILSGGDGSSQRRKGWNLAVTASTGMAAV